MRTWKVPAAPRILLAFLLASACLAQSATSYAEWMALFESAKKSMKQGDYPQAEATLAKALAHARSGPHPTLQEAATANELGMIAAELGSPAEAEQNYRRSIALWTKLGAGSRENLVVPLNNLAVIYARTHRLADAEELYLRSLAMRREIHGEDHPSVAIVLGNLCDLANIRRRWTEAEGYCRQAIDILERNRIPYQASPAKPYMNLAISHAFRNDRVQAELFAVRALTIAESTGGLDRTAMAELLIRAAEIYGYAGSDARAWEALERGMVIVRQDMGEFHPTYGEALLLKALLLRRQNRKREAKKLKKQAAALLANHRHANRLGYTVDASELLRPK